MSELLRVRQDSYESYAESQERPPRGNRRGELVVCDFWTQLLLDGRIFHMQVGTESAGINSTAGIDDEKVWMLIDGKPGLTLLPTLYEVAIDSLAAATVIEAMLEIDRAKVRYSSTGNAFVPENLRTDRPRVSEVAACYVGVDVTSATKSTVPGSIEIGHHVFTEDAITTSTGAEMHQYVLSAKQRPLPVVVGTGSVLCHFGASTADCVGWGCFQWAEMPSQSVT